MKSQLKRMKIRSIFCLWDEESEERKMLIHRATLLSSQLHKGKKILRVCGSGCDGTDGCVLETGRTVNKKKEQKRMEERREQ